MTDLTPTKRAAPQKLSDVLKDMRNYTVTSSNKPINTFRTVQLLTERYKNRDNLLSLFSAANITRYAADHVRCICGNAPTLFAANVAFGEGTAQSFLIPILANIAEFSGAREKLTPMQLHDLANVIVVEYGYLNLAEIMLFAHRFKAGAYGKFYGAVDPLNITCALRSFIKERSEEISRIESEKERCRINSYYTSKDTVTYDEYQRNFKNNMT